MKNIAFLAIIMILTLAAFAQNETPKHPIDIKLAACLDSTENQTTAGMTQCVNDAEDAWDKELNKNYNQLMKVLSTEEKALLKKSQKNWLVYRDSESAFSNTMYSNMQGTMWITVAANERMDVIKQRALQLEAYYGMLSEK